MVAAFKHFGGELRLKVKTVGAQVHTFDDLTPEDLITRFHIAQDRIVQNIGHER